LAEVIFNTAVIGFLTSRAQCCYTTLEKLIYGFGTILADLIIRKVVKSTKKTWGYNATNEIILLLLHVVLMQKMLSSTRAIAMTLPSSSTTVCQHTVLTRQLRVTAA